MGTVMVEVVTPAGIVGDADDLVGREEGEAHGDDVAADDPVVERPALEDAEHAERDADADRERNRVAQPERIGVHGVGVGGDDAGRGGDAGRLRRNGNQRGLRNGGSEAEREGEDEKPDQAALVREPLSQALAQREEAHLQALDEERESQHHEHEPADDAAEVGEGLAQDRDLEDRDHHDDRRQVAQCAEDEAGEGEEPGGQPILLQPVEGHASFDDRLWSRHRRAHPLRLGLRLLRHINTWSRHEKRPRLFSVPPVPLTADGATESRLQRIPASLNDGVHRAGGN